MRMWGRAVLLATLSFLIISSLAGLSSAQFSPPVNCAINGSTTDMGTCLANVLPLAMLGILLSLSLVALAYMFDEVIHISSIKGWYKNELKETAKSLMIIAIVISSLAILSGVAATLSGTPVQSSTSPSSIETSLEYLYGTPASGCPSPSGGTGAIGYLSQQQSCAQDAFNYLTGLSLGIGLIKTTQLGLWIPFVLFPIPLPPFGLLFFQFGSDEVHLPEHYNRHL